MAWARHSHATVDPSDPRALGVCDRCGFVWNRHRLREENQWRGPRLQPRTGIFLCPTCIDKPQEQLRTFVLPPDPEPIDQPRPGEYADMVISS